MTDKERSPFTPGDPVPHRLFVGREEQVKEALRYIKQSSHGKLESMFISGERGIGKSSLASFLRYYVINNMNMVGIHVFLGKVSSLTGMVRAVFDEMLEETRPQTWFTKIASLFGDSIKEVGVMGVTVSFNPPQNQLEQLTGRFPEALANLMDRIQDEKTGFLVVLDGIDGIADTVQFANWYKSFVDSVATHYSHFPVCVVLVGLPEQRDLLYQLQPSLKRIFRIIKMDRLGDNEVQEFLFRSFGSGQMMLEREAADLMVRYCSGFPMLMQEVGDATFWIDTDNVIDRKDATRGVVDASIRVGRKYLDSQVYRAIHSMRYRSILGKLPRIALGDTFTRREMEKLLDDDERKVIPAFLGRFTELGVIQRDIRRGRGVYRFVNELYPIYIQMQAAGSER